jgi:hypothetical protein
MVMSSNIFAQRYFNGRSLLRYLPLFITLNDTLQSSPTASFSLHWRGVSLLYKTRTTPGRVLKRRAVDQGQTRIKRAL